MIAIDTNILVRIVTNDDPVQAQRATNILQNHAIFISKTVLLELEWVLHFSYALERTMIASTLQKILTTDSLLSNRIQRLNNLCNGMKKGWTLLMLCI